MSKLRGDGFTETRAKLLFGVPTFTSQFILFNAFGLFKPEINY